MIRLLPPLDEVLSGQLGRMMAGVRVNDLSIRREADGSLRIAKRRRWSSRALIRAGNVYLRWIRADVRVLDDAEWRAKEREFHRRAYGIECDVDDRGWLILPYRPGVTLARYAAAGRIPLEERLQALATSCRALQTLHRIEIPSLRDGPEPFSHGDATLRNVVLDAEGGLAHWIDLDTAHESGMAALDRHADDLRALLYSSAATFRDASMEDVIRAVRRGYEGSAVWDRLRDRLSRAPIHANAFHLAQARVEAGRRRRLERLILALDRSVVG